MECVWTFTPLFLGDAHGVGRVQGRKVIHPFIHRTLSLIANLVLNILWLLRSQRCDAEATAFILYIWQKE